MLKNLINRLFRPTTEGALAGFRKSHAQLQQVADREEAVITRLDAAISKAATQRLDAFGRRDEANRIATKIGDLIA